MTISQLMMKMVNKKVCSKRQLRFKDLAEISDRNEEGREKNVRKMDNKTLRISS